MEKTELGIEIERKFLVKDLSWKRGIEGQRLRQGYLSLEPARTLRVRVANDCAWLTVKGVRDGLTRLEFEYEIPVDDGIALLEQLCHQPVIDKTRYRVSHDRHVWEIDEFHGANEGLIVAEIELDSEQESFEKPGWLGQEVSEDRRYANSSLIRNPYQEWKVE